MDSRVPKGNLYIDKNASYYDVGGISVLDVLKAKLTPEQYKGFILGSLIKYALRYNHKGVARSDAYKLSFYSNVLKTLTEDEDNEKVSKA